MLLTKSRHTDVVWNFHLTPYIFSNLFVCLRHGIYRSRNVQLGRALSHPCCTSNLSSGGRCIPNVASWTYAKYHLIKKTFTYA